MTKMDEYSDFKKFIGFTPWKRRKLEDDYWKKKAEISRIKDTLNNIYGRWTSDSLSQHEARKADIIRTEVELDNAYRMALKALDDEEAKEAEMFARRAAKTKPISKDLSIDQDFKPRMRKVSSEELISGIIAHEILFNKAKKVDWKLTYQNSRSILMKLDSFETNTPNENGEIAIASIVGCYEKRFFLKNEVENLTLTSEDYWLTHQDVMNREKWQKMDPTACKNLLLEENKGKKVRAIHPDNYYPDPNNGEGHFGAAAEQLILDEKALYFQSDIEVLEAKYLTAGLDILEDIKDPTLKSEMEASRRRKILPEDVIISGIDTRLYLEKKYAANPTEIKWWLMTHFKALLGNEPNKDGYIETNWQNSELDYLDCFFIKSDVESFEPKPSNRLITFSDLAKRLPWTSCGTDSIKKILRGESRKKQLFVFHPKTICLSHGGYFGKDAELLIQEEGSMFTVANIRELEEKHFKDAWQEEIKASIEKHSMEQPTAKVSQVRSIFDELIINYKQDPKKKIPINKNAWAKQIYDLGEKKGYWDKAKDGTKQKSQISSIERHLSGHYKKKVGGLKKVERLL
jgi:hypothetical protein